MGALLLFLLLGIAVTFLWAILGMIGYYDREFPHDEDEDILGG